LAYAHKVLIEGGVAARDMTEMFGDRIILVCDLGGGTFDLTLMKIRPNYTFDVIATAGDAQLGGEEWDKVLEDLLVQHYSRCFMSNPRENAGLMQSLRVKAVDAKHALSKSPRVSVSLEESNRREDVVITRAEFQEKAEYLLLRIRDTLTEMLERRNLPPSGIETLIAIGGSSRMPMIGSLLREIVKREFDQSLEPDTAVSQGAAIYAGYRARHPKLKRVHIRTVNPHALGLVAFHKQSGKYVNDVLINANQRTLTTRKRSYPVLEGARQVRLVVIQGELPDPHECVMLGEVVLPKLPPEYLTGANVEVEFTFQKNGLLHVEGRVVSSDGSSSGQVGLDIHVKGDMSQAQVAEAADFLSGISID
jgi:molecular chaperone DnaK (HSP70)